MVLLTAALQALTVLCLCIAFYYHSKIRCDCCYRTMSTIHGFGRLIMLLAAPYLLYRFAWPWMLETWNSSLNLFTPANETGEVKIQETASLIVTSLFWIVFTVSVVALCFLSFKAVREIISIMSSILSCKKLMKHFGNYGKILKNILLV